MLRRALHNYQETLKYGKNRLHNTTNIKMFIIIVTFCFQKLIRNKAIETMVKSCKDQLNTGGLIPSNSIPNQFQYFRSDSGLSLFPVWNLS